MKKIILLASLVLVSCIDLKVADNSVCNTASLGSIPASPVSGITLPPTSFPPVSFDFSTTINKVSDVADKLTLDVSKLVLNNNGDLNWLYEVDVSVAGNSSDTPEAPFATYHSNGNNPGSEVSVSVLMDNNTILRYLSEPITLTFTVSGTAPTTPVNFTNTMCVAVSGQFNKSL